MTRPPTTQRVAILLLLAFGLTGCSGEKSPAPEQSREPSPSLPPPPTSPEAFPLGAGTYWVYSGVVKWGDSSKPDGVATKTLTWKMEVLRSETIGRYEVAVMKGHPGDLTWYTPNKVPGDYLIVRDDNKYYRVERADIPELSVLESLVDHDSLFLQIPPPAGCLARDPRDAPREDTMYCWAGGNPIKMQLQGVKGIPPTREFTVYQLALRTTPDHQFVSYADGVGMIAYLYGHHGSVSAVDMTLIEFHAK